MMYTKYLLCLLLCASIFSAAHAGIRLKNTVPVSQAGACDGSLVIEATGEAGPFTVHIPEVNLTYEAVNGLLVVPELCAATYTIEVSPNSRFQCTKSLSAEISVGFAAFTGEQGGAVQRSQPGLPSAGLGEEADFMLYPNPTDGNLKVRLEGFREAPVQLAFYAGNGQVVHRFRDFRQDVQTIALDLTTLAPGVYFAILQDQNGKSYTKQVIIRP